MKTYCNRCKMNTESSTHKAKTYFGTRIDIICNRCGYVKHNSKFYK